MAPELFIACGANDNPGLSSFDRSSSSDEELDDSPCCAFDATSTNNHDIEVSVVQDGNIANTASFDLQANVSGQKDMQGVVVQAASCMAKEFNLEATGPSKTTDEVVLIQDGAQYVYEEEPPVALKTLTTTAHVDPHGHRIIVPSFKLYVSKWKGRAETPVEVPSLVDLICSWVGAFCGIMLVAGLNYLVSPKIDLPLMVASFGASAVLIFGMPDAKVSQPRNLVGGQVLSAIVGCAARLMFPAHLLWLSAPIGMATALLVMQLTKTVHPPGGASALIAASAEHVALWHGFQFVLTVFLGSVGMLLIAIFVNNITHKRHYPAFWF